LIIDANATRASLEGKIADLTAHIATLEGEIEQLREELHSLNVAFYLRETLSAFEAAVIAFAQAHKWLSQPTRLKHIGNITHLVQDDFVRARLEGLVNILQDNRLPANTFAHARPRNLPGTVLDAWKEDVRLQLSDEEYAWFEHVYSAVLPNAVQIALDNKASFEARKARLQNRV
jgi:hypothetical protein